MNQTASAEEIFHRAMEIEDSPQRDSFLCHACGDDELLRKSIEALLEDHAQATQLFHKVIDGFVMESEGLAQVCDETPIDPAIGSWLGAYRLIRRLGEGGGGIVYMAEQKAPVHRKVAIKILKSGMNKIHVMDRFEAERQALELMEHPNIARLLDAGVTADGRNYFAMELVTGEKITDHCAKQAIPLAIRLQMLQQICSAVQHAHQKGIIHCDLKPSNILVALVEGNPIPKIIDFGISKAAAGQPSEWTRQGFPAGTPAYMSPEQISGSKDIDTRSDIYSLGIVMYELLASRPPVDDADFMDMESESLRHRLLNETPRPPSWTAKRNGIPHAEWNEDLDWIVLKAINKDRECRYMTMRELGSDIARYLADEPVHARPPSHLYRLKKLVQRNRLASSAIAAGVLILAAGFTTSSLLYIKADAAERKQAQLRAQAEERERVTRAAILLLQNKSGEADAEIQRMGGMLTQPSVEARDVFRQLANWNALNGNWKACSQRLLALSRVNRFDENDMTDNVSRDLVAIAPTLIEAGESEFYKQFEIWLLERMERTANPIAAEQVLKICLLLPPPEDILLRLNSAAAVAEKSLLNVQPGSINRMEVWRCYAIGLWKYRTGQYDRSRYYLTLAVNAEASRTEKAIMAVSLAVRSMAFRKLKNITKADDDLAQADAMIHDKFAVPLQFESQGFWHDWLSARILLQEAKRNI